MDLSLVICAYDMQRELPRTIYTLAENYQRGIVGLEYEILVVDNGSPKPIEQDELRQIAPNVRVIRVNPASQSPATAINSAVRSTDGRMVGIFIDGARMASPGLLRHAVDAYRSDPSKMIGSLSFHLGSDVQMRSVPAGYDQATEDSLLASVPWREDGYLLFSISVLAGSSREGWFGSINESNAVFFDRALWARLGGLDERFTSPGGGMVNLDLWARGIVASDYEPWFILGEGTFHQVHGGAATNGEESARQAMADEYRQIFGTRHNRPPYKARLIGTLDPELARRHGRTAMPPRHVQSVQGRPFDVGVPAPLLDSIQSGTFKTRYKGRRLLKNPFDLALYLRLLERLQPSTIIEIGTLEGGSALWFRDQCRALSLACRILTMDQTPPATEIDDVSIFQVDATRPKDTFPHSAILASPHPWLVVEDSAHTYESTGAVLDYFQPLLEPGDYLVVEDGVVADFSGAKYRQFEDGPNRAVSDFLLRWPDQYVIDSDTCDFYGPNVTYCPNGWLVRTGGGTSST